MPKSFKQRLQYYKTYVYNYYINMVKDSLELALIIALCIIIFTLTINHLVIEQPQFKSWGWDGNIINESSFIKYFCINNVTLKFNGLNNMLQVVPNESNDICEKENKP